MAEMTEATPVFEQDLDVELAKRLENMRDEETRTLLAQAAGFFGCLLELIPEIHSRLGQFNILWKYHDTAWSERGPASSEEEKEQCRKEIRAFVTRLSFLGNCLRPVKDFFEAEKNKKPV
jgi:hypothetical protein